MLLQTRCQVATVEHWRKEGKEVGREGQTEAGTEGARHGEWGRQQMAGEIKKSIILKWPRSLLCNNKETCRKYMLQRSLALFCGVTGALIDHHARLYRGLQCLSQMLPGGSYPDPHTLPQQGTESLPGYMMLSREVGCICISGLRGRTGHTECCWIQDAGCRVLHARFRILDLGPRKLDPGSCILDPESRILDP